jgi:hypothetical protein
MLWDIACVGSIGAALYVRVRWGDQRGGALLGMLSMVCSIWSACRARWRRDHIDGE